MIKFILLGVLLLGLSSCAGEMLAAFGGNGNGNSSSPAPALMEAPALIRPIAARIDTARVERGPVKEVTTHWTIMRVLSEPITFGNISDRFGEWHVQSGDFVYEGQLLASLDLENIDTQIENQEAQVMRMIRSFERDNRLRALDIAIIAIEYEDLVRTSAENFDQAAMDAAQRRMFEIERLQQVEDQARERHSINLRNAQDRLEYLRDRRERSELFAPFTGYITMMANRSPGQWIPAFDNVIFIAPVQELFLEYVESNDPLTPARYDRIQAERIIAHIDGNVYEIEQIPITIEERQLYSARDMTPPDRFRVLNPSETTMQMGRGALIRIYHAIVEDTLRIPINALFTAPGDGPYVYRVENNMNIPVTVEVGMRTGSFVEIISGLAEGDIVYVRS